MNDRTRRPSQLRSRSLGDVRQGHSGRVRTRDDETEHLEAELRRLPARLRAALRPDPNRDDPDRLSPADRRMLEEVQDAVLGRREDERRADDQADDRDQGE